MLYPIELRVQRFWADNGIPSLLDSSWTAHVQLKNLTKLIVWNKASFDVDWKAGSGPAVCHWNVPPLDVKPAVTVHEMLGAWSKSFDKTR